MATISEARLFAPVAWVAGEWRERVLFTIDARGCWQSIDSDLPEPPADATILDGPALPGMVNAHSHAFQRAFAGLAEQRGGARRRLLVVARSHVRSREPDRARRAGGDRDIALRRDAAWRLYAGLRVPLPAARARTARRYADPIAMPRALCDAAASAGIGLTLLPALYERAGFGDDPLRVEQRRFATTVDDVIAIRDGVRALQQSRVTAGVAIHSLRAARPASIAALVERCARRSGPDPCPRRGADAGSERLHRPRPARRPIDWLLRNVDVDARWHLVHATHTKPDEVTGVDVRQAGVVLCPTTEANLGDGLPDLPAWLASGAGLSLGSDSQVTRDWREELRLLEYGQRLSQRCRNIAADDRQSTAAAPVRAGGRRRWRGGRIRPLGFRARRARGPRGRRSAGRRPSRRPAPRATGRDGVRQPRPAVSRRAGRGKVGAARRRRTVFIMPPAS